MNMMLADPTGTIESECAMPETRQQHVAETYALALRDEAHVPVDWKRANAAILKRWPKGLQRVKALAWKILEQRSAPPSTQG